MIHVAHSPNPERRPLHPDVVLSTGRIVTHSYMENGAQFAAIKDDDLAEMTDAEWEEYCIAIKGA
jgi:hypothetical protein